ncbi:coiled-coil domain-containing protein 157-like isoform X1 [Octopus sinensis]|uniref:Coiled-coil domain-containing protein 157-like isoform X1 n=2 Tax=Octopus sinensis TaxID=2607531 RepID=A0A6P7SS36_9MOLL|nr:coiled-coil domain-containing protein 157-like isoform X1 [Octopus sinensis]
MADLLGSAACLDSLREDIFDLQAIISEYISRLGPLSYPSWKFPSQQAGDIDIEKLLIHYLNFTSLSDENQLEAKQIAHIAFYDLLIDRMVYLLHVSNEFSKSLLKMLTKGKNILLLNSSNLEAGNNSVGLVARQSWVLHEFLQKTLLRILDELKDKKKQHVTDHHETSTCKSAPNISHSSSSRKPMSPDGSLYSFMSKDMCFKSTQTVETAFLPCESCSVIQRSFKRSAFAIFKTCQKLNLPSNVNKLIIKPEIDDSWMSFNETTKYSYEQDKDLGVICRQIETLVTETEHLKTEMALMEKKNKSLENHQKATEKKLASEKETNVVLQKQHQTKLKEIYDEKGKLQFQIKSIGNQLETCRENLRKEQKNAQDFKLVKAQLTEELKKMTEATQDREEFQEKMNQLRLQNTECSEKLAESAKELALTQAKCKSILKHSESMQKKQDSLLERVEQLSEENLTLHDQLADLQDDIDENLEKYDELLKEKIHLQQQLKYEESKQQHAMDEKNENEKLLTAVRSRVEEITKELKKTQEREVLLVQYPDLNGPVLDDNLYSGHLEKDMALQLKSNIVRIELLEKQNLVLRNTLEKICVDPLILQTVAKLQPIPLWNIEKFASNGEGSYNKQQYIQQSREKYSHMINKEEDERSIAKALYEVGMSDPTSKSTGKNKHAAARCQSSDPNKSQQSQQLPPTTRSSGSIQTYKVLKQLGKMHHGNSRPKTADTSSTIKTLFTKPPPRNAYVCKNCDKLYLLERELSIHYLYCKG